MCFEIEIPSKIRHKNKNDLGENLEIEPELEKAEEPIIVSSN
jgi:hypothetical protein